MNKKALVTELEQRYTVVKHKHAEQVIGGGWQGCCMDDVMANMARAVDVGKIKPYSCIVIESDWPEYAPVKEALLARINGQPGTLAFTHAHLSTGALNIPIDKELIKLKEEGIPKIQAPWESPLMEEMPGFRCRSVLPKVQEGMAEWLDSNYDLRTVPFEENMYREGWTRVPKDTTCVVREGISLQFFQLTDNHISIKRGGTWEPTGYSSAADFFSHNWKHIKFCRLGKLTREYLNKEFKLIKVPSCINTPQNWIAVPDGAMYFMNGFKGCDGAFYKKGFKEVYPVNENNLWVKCWLNINELKENGGVLIWQRDPEIVTGLPDVSTLTNGIQKAMDTAAGKVVDDLMKSRPHSFKVDAIRSNDIAIDGVRLNAEELNIEFNKNSSTGITADAVLETYWNNLPIEERQEAMRKALKESLVKNIANKELSIEDLPAYEPNLAHKYPHYHKDVSHLQSIDVYRVLELYGVTDNTIGHAIKKLLCAGQRGAKDAEKDIREAVDTLNRRLQMLAEDENKHGYDRS